MTGEFETAIEVNGYPRPAMVEYEDHPVDGISVISVIVSREVRDAYTPDGRYLAVDHIAVDITALLTDEEKEVLADEIAASLREESENARAESIMLDRAA